jgi:hypothetical protein
MSEPKFNRPPLTDALTAWREHLLRHQLPAESHWIFAENLCIEAAGPTGNLQVHFQTRFTPPDGDALEIAYDHFCGTDSRLVFYRLGSGPQGSICILLCDPWFENRGENEGFLRQDDWGISFFAGVPGEIEEVTDLSRWLKRIQGHRSFHDFDFAMSLAAIDEIKIHGRVLWPGERYADAMLNRLRLRHGNPS